MLIQPDRNELGDKRLDPKENLAKLKEGNQKLTDARKIYGQEQLENKEMAMGKPMSYQDLIFLLKKMCPNLYIGDGGMPNAIQVRVPAWLEDGTYGTKYITGFYKEVLPEFSWVTVDSKGLPEREKRGWRTVVIALVKQGIVPYQDAIDIFGEPRGQRAGRWQELLKKAKYKN